MWLTKSNGFAPLGHFVHLPEAFFLELAVPHCKDLIYNEDFRIEVGCHCKGKTDIHTTGIAFDGGVDKLFDPREVDYLIELSLDLCSGHPQDGTVQKYILPTGEFRMEAGSDFQETCHPSLDLHVSSSRCGNSGKDLQQRRFPGAVPTDDPENLALFHPERHVSQRPKYRIRAVASVDLAKRPVRVFLALDPRPPALELRASGNYGLSRPSGYCFQRFSIFITLPIALEIPC